MRFSTSFVYLVAFCISSTPALAAAIICAEDTAATSTTPEAQVQALLDGNRRFAHEIEQTDPGLLQHLAENGQKPPFMYFGCSDSRVSESQVFEAKPGTLFTQRNIANRFNESDTGINSALAYAVSSLGVQHVIVMGHYGCGGVEASMTYLPDEDGDFSSGTAAIRDWIEPIHDIFVTSNRSEIVEFREKSGNDTNKSPPASLYDPAFMALVEENVKAGVLAVSRSAVLRESYDRFEESKSHLKSRAAAPDAPKAVFIHGWVYNIETGLVKDLNVTISPPGVEYQAAPPATLKRSGAAHIH